MLLAVPNDDFDAMLVRLRAIGPGALVYQYAAEATLIAGDTLDEEDATVAALELTERAEPPYAICAPVRGQRARRRVVRRALPRRACRRRRRPSPARRLAGLEAANRELWAANAALGPPARRAARAARRRAAGALRRPARRRPGRRRRSPRSRASTDDAHARHREKELEMWDEIQRLDTALKERIGRADQVSAERDAANARHDVLKRRKAVRLALGLAALRPRRR